MYPIVFVGGLIIAAVGAMLPNPKEKRSPAPGPVPAPEPAPPSAPAIPKPTDPLPSA